jgi:Ala-tRNA(Pro) deacylase
MTIAPKLHQYLDDQHADYDVIMHPPTQSAMQTARVCHIPAGCMAKAVLLDTPDEYLLAVLPADRRIGLTELRSELGAKPRVADEDEIVAVFDDCAFGAVPPLGAGYGLVTIIDDSLLNQPDIYFEGGDHSSMVHMNPA